MRLVALTIVYLFSFTAHASAPSDGAIAQNLTPPETFVGDYNSPVEYGIADDDSYQAAEDQLAWHDDRRRRRRRHYPRPWTVVCQPHYAQACWRTDYNPPPIGYPCFCQYGYNRYNGYIVDIY